MSVEKTSPAQEANTMQSETIADKAKAEAEALADRAGIDIGDDRDMFVADLAATLSRFAALSTEAEPVAVKPNVAPASDSQIAHMKRFWKETPDKPTMRELNAALLKGDFLSLIARLEVALSAQVQDVAGWKDICTAPKDGTKILAVENFNYGWEDENGVAKTRPGDWCVVSWHPQHEEWIGFGMMLSSFTPTHWMPLPAAPAAKQGEGE